MSRLPFAGSIRRTLFSRMFARWGFKRTIFIPFGILLAGAFASSWWLHVRASRDALFAVVDGIARSASSRAGSELAAFLAVPNAAVAAGALHWSDFGSLDDLPETLARKLADFPDLDILSVGREDGEYAEAQRLPDGSIRLGRAGAETDGALVLYSLAADGTRIVWDAKAGYDPRGRPWYLRARNAAGVAWSEPYEYVSTGTSAVAAAKAFIDERSGKPLGVVSATIGLGSLASFLASMEEIAQGGAVAVVSGDGRVIASAVRTAGGAPGPAGAIRPLTPVNGLPAPLDSLFGGFASMKSGLTYSISAGDERWRVVGEPVRAAALDWTIVLALPESRFLAPLEAAEHRVGLIYAAAYLAALGIAFLISHGIARPLRTLGAAATAFASRIDHDGDDPLHPYARELSFLLGRKDELGRLALTFAELRARLHSLFKSLNASLSEKDVLLREVHHRVKNNLQIVSSLISLQEGEFDDPKFIEAMGILQDRVRAMAVVHETIYSSGSFSSVPMDDYLSRLTESLSAYRSSALELELAVVPGGVGLPLEQAIPCGLIAVELATNAIKHAFAGRSRGRVELGVRPEGEAVLLAVSDDGVGLSLESGGSGGMGVTIVAALASQLKGSYAVRTGQAGTVAEVRFPRPGA
jgi:two-component sensor histidine kinase